MNNTTRLLWVGPCLFLFASCALDATFEEEMTALSAQPLLKHCPAPLPLPIPDIPWRENNCKPQGCGLNGSWLGDGVPFRTLDLKGGLNDAGIKIDGFWKGDKELKAYVNGDELFGRQLDDGTLVTGSALVGAVLHLSRKLPGSPALYKLYIRGVTYKNFWTRCLPTATSCSEEPSQVPHYQLELISPQGCQLKLCEPGLSEDPDDPSISGTAVIFRGDLYTDDYRVRTREQGSPLQIQSSETGIFNIACVGTVLSKVHLLRHTEASQDESHTTTRSQRQTMLRMLTGDYCGVGKPFTRERHPLKLAIDNGSWDAMSAYDIRDAAIFEARWDENGATCLGKPRLADVEPVASLRTEISELCRDNHHPLSVCQVQVRTPRALLFQGKYAVSGNSPPN